MAEVINDSNFKDYLAEGKPVLVDFWATWCGPCRAIAPTVDEIAEEYAGRLIVGKCNVDDSVDLPMEYGVRNIPTLLFFKDGHLVDRLVGANPKAAIVEKVESILN